MNINLRNISLTLPPISETYVVLVPIYYYVSWRLKMHIARKYYSEPFISRGSNVMELNASRFRTNRELYGF